MSTITGTEATHRGRSADARDPELTSSRRLREVAAGTPDRVAVSTGTRSMSYAELDRAVDGLAARLIADLGVGTHAVGLRCQGTIEMFVAALGIARSGKVSVPIDPTAPSERVAFILKDVAASLLLTDVDVDGIDAPTASPLDHDAPVPDGGVDAETGPIASIVFTSGSTGVPKGIVLGREQLIDLRHASFFAAMRKIEAGSHVGALTAGTVGFSETLVHCIVQLGVTFHAYEIRRLGLGLLASWLDESQIMACVLVPTVLRYFLPMVPEDRVFSALELVVLTGETSTWEDARSLRRHLPPGAVVYNSFGLTEASNIAVLAIEDVPAGATGALPAGQLVPGVSLTIVDEAGQPVPDGEPGEIVVAGQGCALGYWNRPELSARTFAVLPDGTREVRTGDGGRWRRDGVLEHLGRLDHLVKISGNRVELGEIETTLRSIEGVAAAVAVPHEDSAGNTRLLAFVVPEPATTVEPWVLRAMLTRRLPGPMIPDRIELVEELPQLANGKVDRQGLAASIRQGYHGREVEAPSLEGKLTALFAEILEVDEVAFDDNFFELGGDSLRAARLFVELESRHGFVRPMSMLLEAPTPRTLGTAIEAGAGAFGLLLPIQVEGFLPPLFVVHDGIGDVYYAARLSARLGPDRPVYAIQSPLFQGAIAPETTIEEVATRYVNEVRCLRSGGPYLLYGFSLGGLIAFEMARQLQAAGAEVSFLGLGDSGGPRATGVHRATRRLRELQRLSTRQAVARGVQLAIAQGRHLATQAFSRHQRLTGTEFEAMQAEAVEMANRGDQVMYHYGAMSLEYDPPSPFIGSVLLIRAGGAGVRPDRGWGGFVTGQVVVRDVDGEHNQLGKEPYVHAVGDEVARYLELAVPRS